MEDFVKIEKIGEGKFVSWNIVHWTQSIVCSFLHVPEKNHLFFQLFIRHLWCCIQRKEPTNGSNRSNEKDSFRSRRWRHSINSHSVRIHVLIFVSNLWTMIGFHSIQCNFFCAWLSLTVKYHCWKSSSTRILWNWKTFWWKKIAFIWYLSFYQWTWKSTWTHCHRINSWNPNWCAATCIKSRRLCYFVINAVFCIEI